MFGPSGVSIGHILPVVAVVYVTDFESVHGHGTDRPGPVRTDDAYGSVLPAGCSDP